MCTEAELVEAFQKNNGKLTSIELKKIFPSGWLGTLHCLKKQRRIIVHWENDPNKPLEYTLVR